MATMSLELPEEIFSALRRSLEEFVREMRLAVAIHWYARSEVSQEKAAQIAGLDRTDFLLALAREQVDVLVINIKDLKRELFPRRRHRDHLRTAGSSWFVRNCAMICTTI